MDQMNYLLIFSYATYSLFVFYQQLFVKHSRGANPFLLAAITIFSSLAIATGVGFLIYYGYKVSWLEATGIFLISQLVKFAWISIEGRLKLWNFSRLIAIVGFIGIPVCGYLMWSALVRLTEVNGLL